MLALLLLWADGSVQDDAREPPDWAAGWLAGRAAKAGDVQPREPADPKTAAKRAEQREARVATGLAELDRWLCDQVRQGLAASQKAGYGHWDDIAARMVDAQAPGPAERLRALASVPHSGAGWDGRLLEEYALLRLLTVAYRRQAELPPPSGTPFGPESGSASARPTCWPEASRSGTTGRCWPAGTSNRTGSGPAGRGCRAARPAVPRSCSASPQPASRSTTR